MGDGASTTYVKSKRIYLDFREMVCIFVDIIYLKSYQLDKVLYDKEIFHII